MTVAAIAIANKKVWAHAIIACVDMSPVFKFTEHILDFVALAIEAFVALQFAAAAGELGLAGSQIGVEFTQAILQIAAVHQG